MRTDINFKEALCNLIPELKCFERKSGGEGTAYFINDSLVVKKYNEPEYIDTFKDIFDYYCEEMQNYAMKGLNVPMIYSWTYLPNFRDGKITYDFYILEERIKGRPLFVGFLEEFYDKCNHLCSANDYYEVIGNPYIRPNLFKLIIDEYIADYVCINEYISSMPEAQLAKFVEDVYSMFLEGKYNLPDIFPSNILLNNKGLFTIDNGVYKIEDNVSQQFKTNQFVFSLINLFSYNQTISRLSECLTKDVVNESYFSAQIERNKKQCSFAIMRILEIMNKYCDRPFVDDKKGLVESYNDLKSILNKDDATRVMGKINFDYGM